MDGLPWQLIGEVSIAVLVVMLILLGRLIPRATFLTIVADRDRQIADWKAATEKALTANEILAEQNNKLLESAATQEYLLRDILRKAGEP